MQHIGSPHHKNKHKQVAGEETWELMEEWRMPRKMAPHCAVTKTDTEIVVFGGYTPEDGYIDIISRLDTTTNVWTDLDAKLPLTMTSFGCLATDIDGQEGALLTGGCINDCIVSQSNFCTICTINYLFISTVLLHQGSLRQSILLLI